MIVRVRVRVGVRVGPRVRVRVGVITTRTQRECEYWPVFACTG